MLDLEVLRLGQWDDLLQVQEHFIAQAIGDDAVAGDVRVVGVVQPDDGARDLRAEVGRQIW